MREKQAATWVRDTVHDTCSLAKPAKTWIREKEIWELPPAPTMKVNVDGSYNPWEHYGATGAVTRDHCGRFVAAGGQWPANAAKCFGGGGNGTS